MTRSLTPLAWLAAAEAALRRREVRAVAQGQCARHGDHDGRALRVAIESHDWERLSDGLVVTASFGVARGDEAASAIDLIALADRRLYAAKHGGRNRVVDR